VTNRIQDSGFRHDFNSQPSAISRQISGLSLCKHGASAMLNLEFRIAFFFLLHCLLLTADCLLPTFRPLTPDTCDLTPAFRGG
jgi:hypothetical protein